MKIKGKLAEILTEQFPTIYSKYIHIIRSDEKGTVWNDDVFITVLQAFQKRS